MERARKRARERGSDGMSERGREREGEGEGEREREGEGEGEEGEERERERGCPGGARAHSGAFDPPRRSVFLSKRGETTGWAREGERKRGTDGRTDGRGGMAGGGEGEH